MSVCLSVAYVGLKSRTERPRKTKIDTEVAHVTSDLDTTFKVKGQGHEAALRGRENVLAVGNCCYVAVCPAAEGASAPTGRGGDRGHIVAAAHLQLVFLCVYLLSDILW